VVKPSRIAVVAAKYEQSSVLAPVWPQDRRCACFKYRLVDSRWRDERCRTGWRSRLADRDRLIKQRRLLSVDPLE